MSTQTECPKCKKEFMVRNHLKYGVRPDRSFIKLAFKNIAFPWINGFEEIYKPNLVVCPQCENEFNAQGYKYFGFVEAKHFQLGLIAAILLFIFSFLAALVWGVLE